MRHDLNRHEVLRSIQSVGLISKLFHADGTAIGKAAGVLSFLLANAVNYLPG